jgi:hypothetical protein
MIQDLSISEIDQVDGGALEGATATAGLLSAGFAALAAVPTPASPALATAAAITGVIGIGIGYFGAVYGASSSSGAKAGESFRQPNVKLK